MSLFLFQSFVPDFPLIFKHVTIAISCASYSFTRMFIFNQLYMWISFDQLRLKFNQLYMWLFRSLVLYIRLVEHPFSISCTCDFFDQLCWIFDQLNVRFQSVVHVTISITCALYSISWQLSWTSIFNQLYMWLSRSVVLHIRSVKCLFSISCTCDFFDQLCKLFYQLNVHF